MNQETIVFEQVKRDIIKKIRESAKELGIEEPVTLFPGFINPAVCTKITGETMIGGDTLPMIMLIGDESGRVYLFALKAILKAYKIPHLRRNKLRNSTGEGKEVSRRVIYFS